MPLLAPKQNVMKQLAQLLALYLPGANTLQVMLTIATVILLIKAVVNKRSTSRSKLKIKKQNREMENNMWAIE